MRTKTVTVSKILFAYDQNSYFDISVSAIYQYQYAISNQYALSKSVSVELSINICFNKTIYQHAVLINVSVELYINIWVSKTTY